MGHIRLGLTYFDSEDDFQEIIEEREQVLEQRSRSLASLGDS